MYSYKNTQVADSWQWELKQTNIEWMEEKSKQTPYGFTWIVFISHYLQGKCYKSREKSGPWKHEFRLCACSVRLEMEWPFLTQMEVNSRAMKNATFLHVFGTTGRNVIHIKMVPSQLILFFFRLVSNNKQKNQDRKWSKDTAENRIMISVENEDEIRLRAAKQQSR